jgi:hypothetical protein
VKRSRLSSRASGARRVPQQRHQALGHDAGDALAQAQVGQQFGRLLLPVKRSSFSQSGWCSSSSAAALHAFGAQRLRQQLLAQLLRLGLRQRLQVVADLGARAAGAHETQPGRIGRRHRRRDHLDHVAVLQLGAQRHLAPLIARPTVRSPTLLWIA